MQIDHYIPMAAFWIGVVAHAVGVFLVFDADFSGFGVTGYAELAGAASAFAYGLMMIVLGRIAAKVMDGRNAS
jgi:hypothetical protein